MLTGNKGEWSELYTFLKILADGRFHAADQDLNEINSLSYPVLAVIRTEGETTREYRRNSDYVSIVVNREEIARIPLERVQRKAQFLFEKIKASKATFTVPEISLFLADLFIEKLKAKSEDKGDIKVIIHDAYTGQQSMFGFSIKSELGRAPTLFNSSGATNFIFSIRNINDELLGEVNALNPNRGKIRAKLLKLHELGCELNFQGVSDRTFNCNLQLIDSFLPEILSHIVYYYYSGNGSSMQKLLELLNERNPLEYDLGISHPFYEYKLKAFLTDVALGMMPGSLWDGRYDATGGYLIVRDDGEIVCYHNYNRNEFQDYLIARTKLETPSSSKYDFGYVYKENNSYYIKLNLQIRFM